MRYLPDLLGHGRSHLFRWLRGRACGGENNYGNTVLPHRAFLSSEMILVSGMATRVGCSFSDENRSQFVEIPDGGSAEFLDEKFASG